MTGCTLSGTSLKNAIILARNSCSYYQHDICVCFAEIPISANVAFDLKYNFILFMAIFPLSGAMAMIKLEPCKYLFASLSKDGWHVLKHF